MKDLYKIDPFGVDQPDLWASHGQIARTAMYVIAKSADAIATQIGHLAGAARVIAANLGGVQRALTNDVVPAIALVAMDRAIMRSNDSKPPDAFDPPPREDDPEKVAGIIIDNYVVTKDKNGPVARRAGPMDFARADRLVKSSTWLEAIVALKTGDECEFDINASWKQGIVEVNGLAGCWTIRVGLTVHTGLEIEQIRCVGQTEAWPR